MDATHDPARTSWVEAANGHPDFPIQNLPLGVFTPPGGGPPRGGVAIGDHILDLAGVAPLLSGDARLAAEAAGQDTLNALLARGAPPRRALRAALSALLTAGHAARAAATLQLHRAADCALHLPGRIGDYTDFFAGIHHATSTGRLFRPDNPLLPNYRWVPVAYHGRASSVRVSGTPVRRPNGQRKRAEEAAPSYGPCRNLDYELELGLWIGPGNTPGEPVPIAGAGGQVAGITLLNDWSARDIQGWESQPLGPFLAKNFATSVSPWIVTAEALAPFRAPAMPREQGDPAPLGYLSDAADQAAGGLDITLEVLLLTAAMRARSAAPARLSVGNARDLYWTPAQMVAHHTGGGCDLRPGDLLGTGTISGPDRAGAGSLIELGRGGREPFGLEHGETRAFLADGDEVILRGRCVRDGCVPIGLGECRGVVLPSLAVAGAEP